MPSVKRKSAKKFKRKLNPFQRPNTQPQSSNANSEEEVLLDDNNIAVLEDYGPYASFLGNLNTDELYKNVPKQAKLDVERKNIELESFSDNETDLGSEDLSSHESDDLERNYEKSRASISVIKHELAEKRLPIKSVDGKIEKVEISDEMVKEHERISNEIWKLKHRIEEEDDKVEKQVTPIKTNKFAELSVNEALEKMAELTALILENPEKNYKSLKMLPDFIKHSNLTVQKRCLLCLLAIYLDIIPGYRIREITEKETTQNLSKDVDELRSFEQGLVSSYRLFLDLLEKILTSKV